MKDPHVFDAKACEPSAVLSPQLSIFIIDANPTAVLAYDVFDSCIENLHIATFPSPSQLYALFPIIVLLFPFEDHGIIFRPIATLSVPTQLYAIVLLPIAIFLDPVNVLISVWRPIAILSVPELLAGVVVSLP